MADHSGDFDVDLDKLRPIVDRALRDPRYAEDLRRQPEAASSVALSENERRLLAALTPEMLDPGKRDAAANAPEVEGQEDAGSKAASHALKRAWAQSIGGQFINGHWAPSITGCGCCSWSSGLV